MTPEQQDYYQEVILEQSKYPHHRGVPEQYTHQGLAAHPLKGDQMGVYLQMTGDLIGDAYFNGEGSAIALASASLMTRAVSGQTREHSYKSIQAVKSMLAGDHDGEDWGDIAALCGIRLYPARVDCALLAWQALEAALESDTSS